MDTTGRVVVVELFPRWTECALCHEPIRMGMYDENFALPMYEGEVDFSSPVCFPICVQCHASAVTLPG